MAALIAGFSPLCYYLPTHGDSNTISKTAKQLRLNLPHADESYYQSRKTAVLDKTAMNTCLSSVTSVCAHFLWWFIL